MGQFGFILLILCIGRLAVNGQEPPVFVNPDVVTVRDFEGWGTSLAWWPDVLGHMSDDVIEEVTTALFSPENLNLNIVRYTIGGTTPGNYTCGPFRTGAATESFRDGPDSDYNWTRDPRQRRILAIAKTLGADIFEAFSNSPPQWMTVTGCSKGNTFGGLLHNNLDEEQADAFADYATEVMKHFQDEWDITFDSYAPFNEPYGLDGIGGWLGNLSSQEGCNMRRPVMAAVLRSLDTALKSKGLEHIEVAASDETQFGTATGTQDYFRDNGVSPFYSRVNAHGYWDIIGNRRDLLSMASHRDGHKLWMSEMGWEETPPEDMTQGLTIANRILIDMKLLIPSSWVYWQAVEGYGQWGVISIPYDNENATLADIKYNSGYYSMLQFSKYVRKGYNILSVNEPNTFAGYNGNNLVLVIVNNGQEGVTQSYSLNMFTSFGRVSATRTSPTEQHAEIQPPAISGKQLVYVAPPLSITTIQIFDALHESSGDLLIDGGFEALADAWKVELGAEGGVFNSGNVWRGNYSGFLDGSLSEVRLAQNVAAPRTGMFYLTATCWADGSTAKLGVFVNGETVRELNISRRSGYEPYALSFPATEADNITVYFYSGQETASSFIDDVSLFYY